MKDNKTGRTVDETLKTMFEAASAAREARIQIGSDILNGRLRMRFDPEQAADIRRQQLREDAYERMIEREEGGR